MFPTKTDGSEPALWVSSLHCKRAEVVAADDQTAHHLTRGRSPYLHNGANELIANGVNISVPKMIVEKAHAPCHSVPKPLTRQTRSSIHLQGPLRPYQHSYETPQSQLVWDTFEPLSTDARYIQQQALSDSVLSDLAPSTLFADSQTYVHSRSGSILEEALWMTDSAANSDFQNSRCGGNHDRDIRGDIAYGSEHYKRSACEGHRRIASTSLLNLELLRRNNSKISAVKEPQAKFSIGLPINTSSNRHPSTFIEPAGVTFTSQLQLERDLEYRHRHTFIGTASLDDFLELLEVSGTFATSRSKVMKAFIRLATKEQAIAREQSISSEGWELVPRVPPPAVNILADYVAQTRIKLGSISLSQFLELLRFDKNDETNAIPVVDAFCSAAHIDGIAYEGAVSKAKAFRRWMVHQTKLQ